MTAEQNHPITPTTELKERWLEMWPQDALDVAARWGADQELEACCEWIPKATPWDADRLRAARRPKPPTLKEQALDAWDRLRNEAWRQEIDGDLDFVRRALEALPD